MITNPRVLVIGATQSTGCQIANLLLKEGYRVRALARDEAKARRALQSAVEIVVGDITKAQTLPDAMRDVDHVIFTAGVTQRPAGERLIVTTEYEGVRNAIAAARNTGFDGRFLYMTSIGVTQPSLAAILLNLVKGNTLKWRRLAEDEVRRSGLDYTIIRAGFLTNGAERRPAIEVIQRGYPLAMKYRISRADVAEAFVQALKHPQTRRTTFEVLWAKGGDRKDWNVLFDELVPDSRIKANKPQELA
jgi:uncharacterized protein YbjT (DUF2867 family)